jgi:hypothetical protein
MWWLIEWDDLNEGAFMKAMESLMTELNAGPGTDPRKWKVTHIDLLPNRLLLKKHTHTHTNVEGCLNVLYSSFLNTK